MNETLSLDDLLTIEQLAERYPSFLSINTLRWQLRHRDTNGLRAACVQLGRKLLISKTAYERWLAGQTGVATC